MLDPNFFTKLNEAENAKLEKVLMGSRQVYRDTITQNMKVSHADYISEMGETAFRRELKRELGQ